MALRLEPDASPVAGGSDADTVPPAPMAAVLLANAARWQLRHGDTSMAVVLRGLSLLIAQAEGARWLRCNHVPDHDIWSANATMMTLRCCTGIGLLAIQIAVGIELSSAQRRAEACPSVSRDASTQNASPCLQSGVQAGR